MWYNSDMVGTIVAFDIGDKRVGVACSDPFGEYAMPSDTYFRTGDLRADVRALARIVKEKGGVRIVCGLPFNADGTESIQTEKTRRFLRELEKETDVPVFTEDERYTTRAAREDLIASGISVKKDKKKHVDSLAAAYILEGYLEKRRKDMKEEYNDYEDDNLVELVDEDGSTLRFEHLLTFQYKNEWYVALAPEQPEEVTEDEDDEGEEIAIYHLVGGEDDEQLEVIEDDELLDEVFAEFCSQYEDFEDADEAESLDSDGSAPDKEE